MSQKKKTWTYRDEEARTFRTIAWCNRSAVGRFFSLLPPLYPIILFEVYIVVGWAMGPVNHQLSAGETGIGGYLSMSGFSCVAGSMLCPEVVDPGWLASEIAGTCWSHKCICRRTEKEGKAVLPDNI